MKFVQIDDPITAANTQQVALERVDSTARAGFLTTTGRTCGYASEDITWVRGWHLPDSDAVKAMLAAQATAPVGSLPPYNDAYTALLEAGLTSPPVPGFPPTGHSPPPSPPPPPSAAQASQQVGGAFPHNPAYRKP